MKSKICSSEYVRTVSRGKSWIPAFLSLGFFLAFPVALLLVVGNWKAARYTPDQLHCSMRDCGKKSWSLQEEQ